MCTSGAVVLKAGKNAVILPDADYTTFINQAESRINAVTRINYSDSYSGLNVDVAKILEDACSSLAAIPVINYDMSVYTSPSEAVAMINVNLDIINKSFALLKDKKYTDFINAA